MRKGRFRPDFRQFLEAGIQAHLQRPLPKEPRTERMDRPDEQLIQRREGLAQPGTLARAVCLGGVPIALPGWRQGKAM